MVAAIRSRPCMSWSWRPGADVVQARDPCRRLARGMAACKPGDQSPAELDAAFRRETPRFGLCLGTSAQIVTETVEQILGRFQAEAEMSTLPCEPTASRPGLTGPLLWRRSP